jgi:2',3'-cyclic-nucleotide 2'-phosphodiesterase / 3'-nucleotidase / 5'-nucleotidase
LKKQSFKKLTSLIVTLVMVFSILAPFGTIAASAAVAKTFDIVEVTDFHGQLLDSSNTKQVGANLVKAITEVKTANPDRTLIIGGGDLYQGTPTSNVFHGVPVQQVMSNLGMEVTALGNHEFDWGLNVIKNETMVGASYEIVCANVYDKGQATRPFNPYKIITKDGVRIAIIGALTADAPNIILPANISAFDVKDPATEINAFAKDIRDKKLADIVIADIHEGLAPLNAIVNKLHGVDVVFGGHSHTVFDDVNKDADNKDVPTLNAQNAGKGFIDFKLTLNPDNTLAFPAKGTSFKALATPAVDAVVDATAKSIVDKASATLLPIFNEVIGKDMTTFSSIQVDSPYGESQLGNWMADVVKNYAKADVGVVNNGGIRLSPIPAGDITVGTIFNIMPFDNTVTYVNMTGAQLKFVLNQAVADGGKGIQISGVKFTYDTTKASGKRVVKVYREKDNTEVLDTDTLKVAGPDFVLTGGDGFSGFIDPAVKATYVDTHANVRDALNADVRAKSAIVVNMNNRIVNLAKTINIVGTSDLHGALMPYDYAKMADANLGLAKVSTYVNNLRALNSNRVMLIDNGDTIQGTPLASYYDQIDTTTEYPMMKAMGAMHYDAWTLGNHEYNFGLDTLGRIMKDADKENIAVLSANTYMNNDTTNFVKPYIIKSFVINGKTISVAILGLTTKTIPSWEDPAHYKGLQFDDLVDQAKKWVPMLKNAGVDVVIVSAHSGISTPSDTIPENEVDGIATKVSGIDAILAGHAHTGKTYTFTNPDGKVVPVVEPKNTDSIFSQIDINIDGSGNVASVTGKNVTMDATAAFAADPKIVAIGQPYQDKTLEYLNTIIGTATEALPSTNQEFAPTALMDLINKTQIKAAGTQLSIAAPLSATANIPKGDVKLKDLYNTYVYENFLFGIKMNGAQIKKWLEFSDRYYKQTAAGDTAPAKDTVLNAPLYNLDVLYGATYDIDLTQPVGSRVKNLSVDGKLVKDTDVFTVAINNYRFNGGGGFMAAAGLTPGDQSIVTYDSAKVLGDAGQIRSLMVEYIKAEKTITPTTSPSWKLSITPVTETN